MVFSTPLAAWSDRVGRVRLAIGWMAYGLVYPGLGLAPPATPWLFFALLAFYGLFMAATEGVERALVADLAPEALRGTAYGWFNLTAGILLLPASVIFGESCQQARAHAAFAFSVGCALTAALLLPLWALRAAARDSIHLPHLNPCLAPVKTIAPRPPLRPGNARPW